MGFSTKVAKIFTTTRSKLRAEQLAGMRDKLEMCSDKQIKAVAEELMSSRGGGGTTERLPHFVPSETLTGNLKKRLNSSGQRKIIDKAEHLVDTVNVAEGKYCPLYNEMAPTSTTGFLTKFFERFGIAKPLTQQARRATYSAPRSVVLNSPGLLENPNFETVTRFSSLKRFISKYPQDTKMTAHLYEKYYLSTLEADTAKFLREIDSEFGVKVFMDKPLSKAKLQYLREELTLAKKAGGASVEYPPLIDITDFDPAINRYFGAYGIAVKYKAKAFDKVMYGRRVAITDNHLTDTSFRHEFVGHYNDSKLKGTKFTARKIKLTPKQIEELENAGIPRYLQDYAAKNTNELKAVSVQGNIQKYSPEFVDDLVTKGLPDWIRNLEPVDMQKYLSQTFKDKKSLETLAQIRKSLGGNIPNNVSIALLENPDKIDIANELLKLKHVEGKSLFSGDVKAYLDIAPERLETLKKFSKLKVSDEQPYILKMFAEDYEFTPQQVQKLYAKAAKAEQNGEIFDFDKFFGRYFQFKGYIKEQQRAEKLFGNVTNVTRKSI